MILIVIVFQTLNQLQVGLTHTALFLPSFIKLLVVQYQRI